MNGSQIPVVRRVKHPPCFSDSRQKALLVPLLHWSSPAILGTALQPPAFPPSLFTPPTAASEGGPGEWLGGGDAKN